MNYSLKKLWVKIKSEWNQSKSPEEFEAYYNKQRIREISREILQQPIEKRLKTIKTIEDIVLIHSRKEAGLLKENFEKSFKQLNEYQSYNNPTDII